MKQTINIFLGFTFIMIIGYFLVGFSSSVPEPTAGTAAANQSANLSKVVSVGNAGVQGTLLVLIAAMAFSGIGVMLYSMKKK
jgi:hypothetical protein